MADSKTVIERLSEYIKAKKISRSRLEKEAGLANGYLRNSKGGLGAQKLSDILKVYPDLNPKWLLTGEGEMFASLANEAVTDSSMQKSYLIIPSLPEHGQAILINEQGEERYIIGQKVTANDIEEVNKLKQELLDVYRQNQKLNLVIENLRQQIETLKLK